MSLVSTILAITFITLNMSWQSNNKKPNTNIKRYINKFLQGDETAKLVTGETITTIKFSWNKK